MDRKLRIDAREYALSHIRIESDPDDADGARTGKIQRLLEDHAVCANPDDRAPAGVDIPFSASGVAVDDRPA